MNRLNKTESAVPNTVGFLYFWGSVFSKLCIAPELPLYQGVQRSIPNPTSLSDETLNCWPVIRDALKSEPLLVEPSSAPGHKEKHNNKPTRLSTGAAMEKTLSLRR